jgi:hypothetical protein
MQLADTLDKLHLYDESLKLREQTCNIQIEKGVDADRLFESFDFWAWTCWRAYLARNSIVPVMMDARSILGLASVCQIVRDYSDHPYVTHLQIDLLFTRVAQGEHAEAVRAADAMRREPQFQPFQAQSLLYRLACIYALSVEAVEDMRRPQPLTDEDRKRQAEYRDKALNVLEQSHANGNRDFRTTKIDADLNSIRDDPRFAKILQLEKQQPK